MEKEENKNVETEEVIEPKKKPNKFVVFWKKIGSGIALCFATLWRWTKRMFMGASKELSNDEKFAIENLESPSKMAVKRFFGKKLAVFATVILVLMFGLAFIGPLILPMDLNYSDPSQINLGPNMSLRSVPRDIKDDIKYIDGFSGFSVGVSNAGELRIWGVTKNNLSGTDYSKTPEGLDVNNVAFASAGQDHAIAIDNNGKVFGWGNKTNGQYGTGTEPSALYMPEELNNGINVSEIKQLKCAYQTTALIIGTKLYMWGNTKAVLNMVDIVESDYTEDVKKIAFMNYYAAVLLNDGTVKGLSKYDCFTTERNAAGGLKHYSDVRDFLNGRNVIDIAASDNTYYFITDDNIICAAGAFNYGENALPEIPSGEKVISVVAGKKHAVCLTNANKAYSWGYNDAKQADFQGLEASKVFVGSKQSYLIDENDHLISAHGLAGYLMGTDAKGRDVWTRIIHGGKMTLTIGAVAVIISTVIAVIVGSLSGYFGGWVDILLMRLAEIVGAIPFLPFAMLLSHVLSYTTVSETMRIFIIMVILGVLGWTGLAHMIRGQVLAEREKDFVMAARAMGVKETKIAFKHILPNIISIILVHVTLDFAGCLLTESSLSYLGFGVNEPRATWGNMLNAAKGYTVIVNMWWQWVFPSIFLAISTICINIIGDSLRDVLDPKGSGER